MFFTGGVEEYRLKIIVQNDPAQGSEFGPQALEFVGNYVNRSGGAVGVEQVWVPGACAEGLEDEQLRNAYVTSSLHEHF